VPHDAAAVAHAIRRQVEHGRYAADTTYGDGRAGERIAAILAASGRIDVQKKITY